VATADVPVSRCGSDEEISKEKNYMVERFRVAELVTITAQLLRENASGKDAGL
jgi:hypothetical protein